MSDTPHYKNLDEIIERLESIPYYWKDHSVPFALKDDWAFIQIKRLNEKLKKTSLLSREVNNIIDSVKYEEN